jgi:hypothetical protein
VVLHKVIDKRIIREPKVLLSSAWYRISSWKNKLENFVLLSLLELIAEKRILD